MIVLMVSQSEPKMSTNEPSLSFHKKSKEFNQPKDNQPTHDYEDNLDLAELEKDWRQKNRDRKLMLTNLPMTIFHLREWIIST